MMKLGADVYIATGTAVLAFGFLAWKMSREAKAMDKTMEQYLHYRFREQKNGWILFVVILINLAEAVLSATLHPDNGPQLNMVSRFFMHIGISGVAIIMMVNLPTELVLAFEKTGLLWEFKDVPKEKRTPEINYQRRLNFAIVLFEYISCGIYLAAAFTLPYLNLDVIATGFGESIYAETAFTNLLKTITFGIFGKPVMLSVEGVVGSPVSFMSMAMKSSWFMVICHYILTILDGFTSLREFLLDQKALYSSDKRTADRYRRSSTYTPPDDEDAEKLAEDVKSMKDKFSSILSKVYNAGYTDSVVKSQTKMMIKEFTDMDEEDKISVALSTAKYEELWKTFKKDTRGMSASNKKEEWAALTRETMKWITSSPEDGGLGKTIQTPKDLPKEKE
jgi:hypothetical protein